LGRGLILRKFRKKIELVEAVQFHPDRTVWPEGVYEQKSKYGTYWLDASEGRYHVIPGDWIIKGPNGNYPCSQEAFERAYEAVEAETQTLADKIKKYLKRHGCKNCGSVWWFKFNKSEWTCTLCGQ
jgi:hypothetical protein